MNLLLQLLFLFFSILELILFKQIQIIFFFVLVRAILPPITQYPTLCFFMIQIFFEMMRAHIKIILIIANFWYLQLSMIPEKIYGESALEALNLSHYLIKNLDASSLYLPAGFLIVMRIIIINLMSHLSFLCLKN